MKAIAVLDDGKVLVAGSFTAYNGQPVPQVIRLNVDGTRDLSFPNGSGVLGTVNAMDLLTDGRIAIGGEFQSVNGAVRDRLAILHPDGSLDTTFVPVVQFDPFWQVTDIEQNGAGGITYATYSPGVIHSAGITSVKRVHADGSPDTSFQLGFALGLNAGWVYKMLALPDGGMLYGGRFDDYLKYYDVFDQLTTSGAPDMSAAGDIHDLDLLPYGRILSGGHNWPSEFRVRRFHPTGQPDTAFDQNTIVHGTVYSMAPQVDGTVMVSGTFSQAGGMPRPNVARLLEDGTLDPGFDPGSGFDQGPGCSVIAADPRGGNPVVGGCFASYNGQPVGHLARLLNCQVGAPCDDDDPSTPVDTLGYDCLCMGQPWSFPPDPFTAQLDLHVLLRGPRNSVLPGVMNNLLQLQGLLPVTEPYSALPGYAHLGGGGEVIAAPGQYVDWVFLELRDPSDPTIVQHTRSALIDRNGHVVDIDGGPVQFPDVTGPYHLAVRHRNHLGVMTAAPIDLSPYPIALDLRDGSVALWGTQPTLEENGLHYLWPGNAVPDEAVKYTGSANDRDAVLQAIGGAVPTATATGYHPSDVNLDGVVKYSGTNNDRDLILQTIGGAVPTSTRVQQLP